LSSFFTKEKDAKTTPTYTPVIRALCFKGVAMKYLYLTILIFFSTDTRTQEINPFVGLWKAVSFSVDVPPACTNSLFVQFREDGTLVTTSDDLIIEESYKYIEIEPMLFEVSTYDRTISGTKNCGGETAKFVEYNYINRPVEFQFEDDLLVVFMFGKDQGVAMYLEKVDE
jgi:hypothetical protein